MNFSKLIDVYFKWFRCDFPGMLKETFLDRLEYFALIWIAAVVVSIPITVVFGIVLNLEFENFAGIALLLFFGVIASIIIHLLDFRCFLKERYSYVKDENG